ncbi:TPA: AbrB/MazE/SpoVT family DNA-binding domain-containing protein [archaeon]|nr:AbrB/MazE/SpoVT family DNA-binding domain-containing protein [Candidatus Naiadarchaeales archaeon SRR2090153.bin461]HIK02319.1 AbrB/MazE/SpoVT family DNA-binding domain-containing protein [Candidatus Naiadarchaeales archaeon SRR2090159.bin1288]
MRTIMTRNGQITIPKEIREKLGIKKGTPLQVNLAGNTILIIKSSPEYWKNFRGGFLPKDFEETYRKIRESGDIRKRFKQLGVIP